MNISLKELRNVYHGGNNIIDYIKQRSGIENNSLDMISISYDLQSGSYIKYAKQEDIAVQRYTTSISKTLNQLSFNSILEAGVGEATTLANVLRKLDAVDQKEFYGFDISLSRILYAYQYLEQQGFSLKNDYKLFVGNLFEIPLADNSIDLVYTSHSIEPNGGKEVFALKELYRICKKYLVLVEPCYEFASQAARERMIKMGYITNLLKSARELGFIILDYQLLEYSLNPDNPSGIMILEKKAHDNTNNFFFTCPKTGYILAEKYDAFYSHDGGFLYPVIRRIPCLLGQHAILSTHFDLI